MWQTIFILLIVTISPLQAAPWFHGTPQFADDDSRSLAEAMLEAHGGMQPMFAAESLQFEFFTKMMGGPTPFYSHEAVDLRTGNAYIDWPFWNSTVALKGNQLWAHQWPVPMPAGFFVRLTTSFITLPWQIHTDGANVGPSRSGTLPNGEAVYDVLHVTFDKPSPSIPGTYYDIYIDRVSGLMKAIAFDISHPGMVANPEQPLGPNYHVFDEYREFSGLVLPTFYQTYGSGTATATATSAYHFVWNIAIDKAFDNEKLNAPDGATNDTTSTDWWQMQNDDYQAVNVHADTINQEFAMGAQK